MSDQWLYTHEGILLHRKFRINLLIHAMIQNGIIYIIRFITIALRNDFALGDGIVWQDKYLLH